MTAKGAGRSTRHWRKVKAQCYRRDRDRRARCWICGQPIDYAADPGTPDAWEGDHYWPPDVRPDLAEDPTNIRPSHSSCNRSRQRDAVKGLGEPSRDWD